MPNTVRVESLLYKVERPARYLGHELNSLHKDPSGKLRFGICFPDIYEVGMSHLGVKILYHLLNEEDWICCERVFAPWLDMEELLRKEGIPLFTLENRTPVRELDVLGFSLPYEMLYSNVLNILELSNIALRNDDRRESDPIIIAGGPACFNPEPVADFIDVFVLGEAEEVILELCEIARDKSLKRDERIAAIGRLPGCYRANQVDVRYNPDGTLASMTDRAGQPAQPIVKRVIADLDGAYYPTKQIVPSIPIIHDRAQVEIHRGCMWGCRYCHPGMLYRMQRERSLETLVRQSEEIIQHTGYEELGLSSLNSPDYSRIQELIDTLNSKFAGKQVAIGLPSLRMDAFSVELANSLQKVKKTQLTLAPEAGSQRLRDVINKNLTEEDILRTVKAALDAGWRDLKLYFMVGLPTETDQDMLELAELLKQMKALSRGYSGRPLFLTCSVSPFVAKPFTPFQWVGQFSRSELCHKINILRNAVPRNVATLKWREFELQELEGVFSRGDRRLGRVIERAHKGGCKFEGWTECFDHAGWMKAFEAEGIDPMFYHQRERREKEVFPWEVVSPSVSRYFLWQDYRKALSRKITENCFIEKSCSGCGVMGRGMGC
jgi:radical SAM family uncharacterized protein